MEIQLLIEISNYFRRGFLDGVKLCRANLEIGQYCNIVFFCMIRSKSF